MPTKPKRPAVKPVAKKRQKLLPVKTPLADRYGSAVNWVGDKIIEGPPSKKRLVKKRPLPAVDPKMLAQCERLGHAEQYGRNDCSRCGAIDLTKPSVVEAIVTFPDTPAGRRAATVTIPVLKELKERRSSSRLGKFDAYTEAFGDMPRLPDEGNTHSYGDGCKDAHGSMEEPVATKCDLKPLTPLDEISRQWWKEEGRYSMMPEAKEQPVQAPQATGIRPGAYKAPTVWQRFTRWLIE